jgi:hypothetical protein
MKTQHSLIRTPLFTGEVRVDPFMHFEYFPENPDAEGSMSVDFIGDAERGAKESALYKLVRDTPLKLQLMPFEFVPVATADDDGWPSEKTEGMFFIVAQVLNYNRTCNLGVTAEIVFRRLTSLEYMKAIQAWKWTWGEPEVNESVSEVQ